MLRRGGACAAVVVAALVAAAATAPAAMAAADGGGKIAIGGERFPTVEVRPRARVRSRRLGRACRPRAVRWLMRAVLRDTRSSRPRYQASGAVDGHSWIVGLVKDPPADKGRLFKALGEAAGAAGACARGRAQSPPHGVHAQAVSPLGSSVRPRALTGAARARGADLDPASWRPESDLPTLGMFTAELSLAQLEVLVGSPDVKYAEADGSVRIAKKARGAGTSEGEL